MAKKLFVVEKRVQHLAPSREMDSVSYLQEIDSQGALGNDYHWSADINEAFLFHNELDTPAFRSGVAEGNARVTYAVIPVEIKRIPEIHIREPKRRGTHGL